MSKIILVVDDDANIRNLIIEVLNVIGCKSTGARNGKQALELLTNHTFDLITLDISMPEMDGIQFLKELIKVAPSIKVILVTGISQFLKPHPQVKAVITKPFDIEQLLAVVNKYAG